MFDIWIRYDRHICIWVYFAVQFDYSIRIGRQKFDFHSNWYISKSYVYFTTNILCRITESTVELYVNLNGLKYVFFGPCTFRCLKWAQRLLPFAKSVRTVNISEARSPRAKRRPCRMQTADPADREDWPDRLVAEVFIHSFLTYLTSGSKVSFCNH